MELRCFLILAMAVRLLPAQSVSDAADNELWAKTHPPRESTGMVPLPDLGMWKYQGAPGGLYPSGRNTPPKEHLDAGLALAKKVLPLDANGLPSEDGKIVYCSQLECRIPPKSFRRFSISQGVMPA
jgi:hypothetical protein